MEKSLEATSVSLIIGQLLLALVFILIIIMCIKYLRKKLFS